MKMTSECEACKKRVPWYMLSKVQVISREFIGKVTVCDICYIGISGERLRTYKGFFGWLRKKLLKIWEEKHKKEVIK